MVPRRVQETPSSADTAAFTTPCPPLKSHHTTYTLVLLGSAAGWGKQSTRALIPGTRLKRSTMSKGVPLSG
jgi:hypothetical protein